MNQVFKKRDMFSTCDLKAVLMRVKSSLIHRLRGKEYYFSMTL